MADFYEKLAPHVDKIRIPGDSDKIHKDECVFSFDTPDSEGGLYVCLNTFLGFAKRHVEKHYAKTGNAVYLHLETVSTQKQKEDSDHGKKYEYEDRRSLVILPDFHAVPLPDKDLPQAVQLSVAAIIAADSATVVAEQEALEKTSQEMLEVSWYSVWLEQLDNGVRVPPKGWKCKQCGSIENLWMNLTDGSILCAETTSRNSDHLYEHYEKTGYPLAVKLGTIGPNGADVYSFDERQMVIDTKLAKHLRHFGIEMAEMRKTEKTALELHIEKSRENEAERIQADFGQESERPFGPGYTGLTNLGNACYMNAIVQVIMTVPDFKKKYYDDADHVFDNAPPDPSENFTIQMTKLAVGILSGEYSKPAEGGSCSYKRSKARCSIKPLMFKAVIGKNNPDYLPLQQQDAQEFLLCLLDLVEKNCKGSMDPTDCFKFQVEECIQCTESGKVCYTKYTDLLLALPIPLESALNGDDVNRHRDTKHRLEKMGAKVKEARTVKYKLPLSACLDAFASTELIKDFYSTAVNRKVDARKTTRLRTFPDYLIVQLKKFFLDNRWKPQKLDVEMLVPDELDLNFLRGNGPQPGEELLPEPEENRGPAVGPGAKTADVSEAGTEPPADPQIKDGPELPSGPQIRDGPGNYQLVAFVSHMGPSARHGHYMCHILKDGTWIMFSNEQVMISPQPPKELGYLYLYRRITDDCSGELSPKRARIDDGSETGAII